MNTSANHPRPFPPTPPRTDIAHLVRSVTGPGRAGRRHLLAALGYADHGEDAHRLDLALATGEFADDLRRHLTAALGLTPTAVDASLDRTVRQRQRHRDEVAAWMEHQERLAFQPHVIVNVDLSRGRMAAVCRGAVSHLMRVDLPGDLAERDEATQRRIARRAVARHLRRQDVRNIVRRLGPPDGYILHPAYGVAIDLR